MARSTTTIIGNLRAMRKRVREEYVIQLKS